MIKYVVLALAMVVAVPAEASDFNWDWGVGSGDPGARHRHRADARRRAYHRRHRSSRSKVMAYERRATKPDAPKRKNGEDEVACVDKVRGLGTQWIGTQGALDAAKKDWMERVRYDHGESYIDLTNAQEFESRCGRTSIGEIAGQVTYRCEIMARPCKAQMKATQATKR